MNALLICALKVVYVHDAGRAGAALEAYSMACTLGAGCEANARVATMSPSARSPLAPAYASARKAADADPLNPAVHNAFGMVRHAPASHGRLR